MIGPAYPVCAEPAGGLVAVHDRHLHIHQDHVERTARRSCAVNARSQAICPFSARVTSAPAFFSRNAIRRWLSGPSSASRMRPLELDFRDVARSSRLAGLRGSASAGSGQHRHAVQRSGRHGQAEAAPLAGVAADGDVAAEHLRQPLADAQSQSGAAELAGRRGVGLRERLEERGGLLSVMPMPVSITSNCSSERVRRPGQAARPAGRRRSP